MRTVSESIADLHTMLATNANEHQLLELIEDRLPLLRSSYLKYKTEFTDDTIVFLKSLAPVKNALRELIEAIDEKDWVHTRDDAQELASRFGNIGEQLSPHLVAKRAEKEMRELVAKAKSLPFAAVARSEADFHRRRAQAESSTKPCQKCGAKMVLCKSQHGYFWGCSTFPQCFNKRSLSKEESGRLFGER